MEIKAGQVNWVLTGMVEEGIIAIVKQVINLCFIEKMRFEQRIEYGEKGPSRQKEEKDKN